MNKRISSAKSTFLGIIFVLFSGHISNAQTNILGSNLIVNGGAEAGPAGTALANVVGSIPGWTRTGSATVLSYDLTNYLQSTEPAPRSRGFQYFVTGSGTSTLTQDIDVSAAAAAINGGGVKYTASAYLGKALRSDYNGSAQVVVAFKNAAGQSSDPVKVGPLPLGTFGAVLRALYLQEQTGLVPAGTVRITVTMTLVAFNGGDGAADNVSLVLSQTGPTPTDVNLLVNGDAEAGGGIARPTVAQDIPGWSRADGASVTPYGGTGWIGVSSPGPTDRGVNLFCGGGSIYQDLDVSGIAQSIDAGQVKYEVSAWVGGIANTTSPTLTYLFFDWPGKQLAATGQLLPTNHTGIGLVPVSHSDMLPSGTRRVRIMLTFPNDNYAADDISFVLRIPNGRPTVAGVVSASAFGGFPAFAPGSWIEIYGSNLSANTRSWTGADIVNGNAPRSLDGVSVSIGGMAAFLDYISPGQIVALVPSNAPTGSSMPVTVTNSNGTSIPFSLPVNPTQPGLLAPDSFKIGGNQYVVALFSDGQTFVLPQGAIAGAASRPARPGETITLYGVGFGPVDHGFVVGAPITGANTLNAPLQFLFGTTPAADPSYDGLAPGAFGLYQFNIVVPSVGTNNLTPLSFDLGGTKGSQKLYIAVQN